jgi:hypothetical protein
LPGVASRSEKSPNKTKRPLSNSCGRLRTVEEYNCNVTHGSTSTALLLRWIEGTFALQPVARRRLRPALGWTMVGVSHPGTLQIKRPPWRTWRDCAREPACRPHR